MKKNRGMKKSLIVIGFLLLMSFQSVFAGNNVRLQGSAKQVVRVGETFQVVYELNANGGSFEPPNFGSLSVLSGPNVSSSSNIQLINGHMSQSYTVIYSFYVQATQPGKITIGPAAIIVKGKKVTSNSLKINVVKGNAPATATQGSASGSTNSNRQSGTNLPSDNVYIKATVSNKTPYLGQQIILTYDIYTKVPVSNLNFNKLSSFGGFWSKDLLSANSRMKQQTKYINGVQYVVAEIRKMALFPQKTGKLTIDPMELDCNVQMKVKPKRRSRGSDPFDDFFNDPFFNRNVRNIKKTLRSKTIVVNVKPLPQEGKPVDFSGAVGNFSFQSGINQTHLTTNDALTLDVTISGKGNIELIDAPKIQWPPDFDAYDPKVTAKINTSSFGVSGRKKFEFTAIPRNPGDFVIPPIKFSFFNPEDKKYHYFTSDTMRIHVVKGKGGGNVTYSSNAQEDIHFLGKDIHHIKSHSGKFNEIGDFLFASPLYYLLLGIPVVILILMVMLFKMIRKRRGNVPLMKNRKAHKMARSRLSNALKLKKAGDDKLFYEEIAQALWGYISDKFNIHQAELSMETVKEKLKGIHTDEKTVDTFIKTLNDIEFARFAPGSVKDKMEQIYSEAMEAILKAEKAIK